MKNNRGKRASSVFSATCPTPPRTPFIFETPFAWPERRALVSQWKPDGISAFLGPRRSPVTADSPSDSPRWTWPWKLRVRQGWGKPESVLVGLPAPAVAGSSFRAGDVSSSRKGVQGPCGCGVGGHVCVQKPQSRLHRINSTRKFWMFFSDGCH